MENKQYIEHLKAMIAEQEAIIKRSTGAVLHLRQALSALAEETVPNDPTAPKKTLKKPFTPKYSESSDNLVMEFLKSTNKAMSHRQIVDGLARQGKEFSIQALWLTINRLLKVKRIKKQNAPNDSRHKFVYRLAKEQLNQTEVQEN